MTDNHGKAIREDQPDSRIKDAASGMPITDQASSNDSPPAKIEQESVTKLPAKRKAASNSSTSRRKFRTWVAFAGFGLLLITAVVSSMKVRHTTFVLTTSSNKVEATVTNAFNSELMKVSEWSLANVQTLTLPNREHRAQSDENSPLAVRPCAGPNSDCCKALSNDSKTGGKHTKEAIVSFVAESDTKLAVGRQRLPGKDRAFIELRPTGNFPANVSVDIEAGQVIILESGASSECFLVKKGDSQLVAEMRGRPLRDETPRQPLTFAFDYPSRDIVLLDDLPINSIHFDEIDGDARSQRAPKSSLLKGELSFLEVPDQKIQFQSGFRLGVDIVRGKLQALSFSDREVLAIISGTATDIRQLIEGESQSIMPTFFEWLSTKPWARSIAAIVTFLLSVLAIVPFTKTK